MNATAQATLLLTAYFSGSDATDTRPLGIKEWSKFAFWLKEQNLNPEILLNTDLKQTLNGWQDTKITLPRLVKLLERGPALALALEKWTRAGLWVLTRSDSAYPRQLKSHLGNDAPPVLFGCGNQKLLNQAGIAVVGSRKASEHDLQRSRLLGERTALAGLTLISGGARGVDETAMLGSLEAEGTAVGVLANDLLRAATSAKYRRFLLKDELVLISACYPEAGFNAGNAMQRNKYIYCLAEAAIAVHSGIKGGTWEGALENLKQQWVPMYVLPSEDVESGNNLLAGKGADSLTAELSGLDVSTLCPKTATIAEHSSDLVAKSNENVTLSATKPVPPEIHEDASHSCTEKSTIASTAPAAPATQSPKLPGSLYECFLLLLQQLTTNSPRSSDELREATALEKGQLSAWLKQAAADGHLDELQRPTRYQWRTDSQADLFKDPD